MVSRFIKEESGQDTFEYMLLIGGVTVAVVIAIAIGGGSLFGKVFSGMCSAIAHLPSMSSVSC